MKIFGFELKWLRTRKSIIKDMLLEHGQVNTKRILKKEGRWHPYDVSRCIHELIHEGALDLDLYRLYTIQGVHNLKIKLIKEYKLNPNKLKIYLTKIRKFHKFQKAMKMLEGDIP